jgi:hypothetical protein
MKICAVTVKQLTLIERSNLPVNGSVKAHSHPALDDRNQKKKIMVKLTPKINGKTFWEESIKIAHSNEKLIGPRPERVLMLRITNCKTTSTLLS